MLGAGAAIAGGGGSSTLSQACSGRYHSRTGWRVPKLSRANGEASGPTERLGSPTQEERWPQHRGRSSITKGVTTAITLKGASALGKAIFIPTDKACSDATPKVVLDETGRGLFTIPSSGDYTLCYRVAGAKDSVAQSGDGVKLQVKAPGVTKEMVGRWQSKDGKLDCSSMDYVPFCGVSLEEKCGQTYTVQSGIGYKCNWNDAVWPPKCAVQSSTDSSKICMSGKCANDACW
eukprot:Skav213264  [mRNA]  locus=scaffold2944:10009:12637:+ [translate_table: standard]